LSCNFLSNLSCYRFHIYHIRSLPLSVHARPLRPSMLLGTASMPQIPPNLQVQCTGAS
jgi:hypothetical protein